jgi:hypothetical protein
MKINTVQLGPEKTPYPKFRKNRLIFQDIIKSSQLPFIFKTGKIIPLRQSYTLFQFLRNQ